MDNQLNAVCRKIKENDLEMIMEWRMRPDITRYMNTDPELTLEKQYEWYHKIQASSTDFYWIIEVDGVPSGVISLVNMDKNNKRVHSGIYIAVKEKRSLRLMVDLQWNLYDYAFEKLGMHKVEEEVLSENKAVIRILDMCGSKQEGILRDYIYKNGAYHDLTVRGILEEEWNVLKRKLNYNIITFE